MADERRREPRVPISAEARVRFTSWNGFRIIYTVNISRGGMNIALSLPQTVGTGLAVELELPSGRTLALEAIVRHCQRVPGSSDNYQVGIEFERLDAERSAEIETLIRTHAP